MNNQQSKNDELWVKCPTGAIQRIADSAIVDRNIKPAVDLRRRNLLAATATAAGVLALGGVSYLTLRQPASNNGPIRGLGGGPIAPAYAGISCVDVVEGLPDYIAGKIEDQEKIESIKQHLELCYDCRENYELQKQG